MYDLDAEQLGRDDRRTLDDQIDIADSYHDQNRLADAEQTLLDTLRVCESSLGTRHQTTLRCKAILAQTYNAMKSYEKAETLLRDVVQAGTDVPGKHMPFLLSQLSKTLYRMGCHEEAEQACEQALEAYTELHGQEHTLTLAAKYDLALVRRILGFHQPATDLLSACVDSSEVSLGTDHPDTIEYRDELSRWKESDAQAQIQVTHHLPQHHDTPVGTPFHMPDEESSSSRSPTDKRASHAEAEGSLRRRTARLLKRRRA